MEEELIDLYTTKKHGDLTAYPVILCNTEDFFSDNHKVYHPAFHELDFSGYHIAILYSGVQPRVPGEETAVSQPCAIAPAKVNAAEFDRFLTWLEEAENYELFHGGGKDAPAGYADFPYLSFFRLDKYESEKLSRRRDLPENLSEALAAVEYNGECPLDADEAAALAETLQSRDMITALDANDTAFRTKLQDVWLFRTTNLDAVPAALFDPALYQDTAEATDLLPEAMR